MKVQLLNEYNKVNMVVTNNGVILPIRQNGIKDYAPFTSLDEYLKDNLLTLEEYIRGINLINKYLSKPIDILGVTVEDNKYTAVQTNFGILIPVRPTVRNDVSFRYPILNFKYYNDADKKFKIGIINSDIEYKLGIIIFNDDKVIKYVRQRVKSKDIGDDEKVDELVKLFRKIEDYYYDKDNFEEGYLREIAKKYIVNMSVVYADTMKIMRDNVYKIKQNLASVISEDSNLIKEIKNINKSVDKSRSEKISTLVEIFKNVIEKGSLDINLEQSKDLILKQTKDLILKQSKDLILKHVANEVINDNIENALLNNMIVPDEFNADEIMMKDTESVLLNIEDIKNWVKKYKSMEDEEEFIDIENE
jgi:hypothetical protein